MLGLEYYRHASSLLFNIYGKYGKNNLTHINFQRPQLTIYSLIYLLSNLSYLNDAIISFKTAIYPWFLLFFKFCLLK